MFATTKMCSVCVAVGFEKKDSKNIYAELELRMETKDNANIYARDQLFCALKASHKGGD